MTIFIRTRRFFSVFTFYVLRFSVSVNAYAHALCSSTSSFKNETSTETSTSYFHFTFFCFFFRLLSISWLVVHVVFFRLSFIHIQKKTKQTHVNFSSFESLIRPLSHQHHSAIYTFYNHESPSFTNQQKKKINKKNKNDRHLVSKTSFNLLVIHV